METKNIPLQEVKMVASESGDGYTFTGYASVWNGNDSYNDTIVRGAYTDVIESIKNGADYPLLMAQHNHNDLPIGRIVHLEEDDYGLLMKAELTKGLSVAEDYRAALVHGTIKGLSIGYSLAEGDYERKENGGRLIKKVAYLGEISIVSFAADRAAKIDLLSVKDALQEVDSVKSLELFLRSEMDCSREAAKAVISQMKSVLNVQPEIEVPEQPELDEKAILEAILVNQITSATNR